ncbi:MAG: CYTH domain-containing protein [Candidatus Woesearchaeota archaeon]
MDEIEVKILEVNVKEVQYKLRKLGAKKVFDGTVKAVYLDDGTLGNKKILRLRKLGDKVQLTYKEHVSRNKFKIDKEHEIYLEDFNEALNHFISLGFVIKKKTSKHRISYRFKDVSFEIDFINGIPPFLEIESSKENILNYASKIGFKRSDLKPWSGKELYEHYYPKKRKK